MPIKTYQDDQPTLNLTPMIDVVFLLIIFFMVGTKFVDRERNIKLDVPRVSEVAALTAAPEKKVVNVYEDGSIILDRETVTLDQMRSILEAAHAEYMDLGVLIRGDADGPFQHVASVLSACRQAGISDMGISVRLARKP